MIIRWIVIFLTFFFLALPSKGGLTWAGDPQSVHLMAGFGYEPYTDPKLKEGGLFTYLVKQIFERAGIKVEVEFLSFRRGYYETQRGDWDAIFPWTWTKEREQHFIFSDAVLKFDSGIFIRKEDQKRFTRVRDLIGKSLCIPDGYTLLSPFNSPFFQNRIQLERPMCNEACLKMLLNNRVDAVEANTLVSETILKKLAQSERITDIPSLRNSHQLHVIFPKSNLNRSLFLRKIFNFGLQTMIRSGERDKIIEEYFSSLERK